MTSAVAGESRQGTIVVAMPSRRREPELMLVEKFAPLIHRDRATIYRWFAAKRLTRHYIHDFEAGVRRVAVDMHEVREKMPALLPPEMRADA